jgi:hypothetical protein
MSPALSDSPDFEGKSDGNDNATCKLHILVRRCYFTLPQCLNAYDNTGDYYPRFQPRLM